MDKSEVCLVYSVGRSGWSGWSSKYIVIHQSSSQISATATLFWSNGENKGEKSRSSTKKATVSLPRWAHSSFHLPTLKLGKGPAQGSWWETWTLGEMRRPSGISTGGTWGSGDAEAGVKILEDPDSRHCFSSQCNLEVFRSESRDLLTTTFTFWIISCFQFALFQSIDEGAIALKALVSFQNKCQIQHELQGDPKRLLQVICFWQAQNFWIVE